MLSVVEYLPASPSESPNTQSSVHRRIRTMITYSSVLAAGIFTCDPPPSHPSPVVQTAPENEGVMMHTIFVQVDEQRGSEPLSFCLNNGQIDFFFRGNSYRLEGVYTPHSSMSMQKKNLTIQAEDIQLQEHPRTESLRLSIALPDQKLGMGEYQMRVPLGALSGLLKKDDLASALRQLADNQNEESTLCLPVSEAAHSLKTFGNVECTLRLRRAEPINNSANHLTRSP